MERVFVKFSVISWSAFSVWLNTIQEIAGKTTKTVLEETAMANEKAEMIYGKSAVLSYTPLRSVDDSPFAIYYLATHAD